TSMLRSYTLASSSKQDRAIDSGRSWGEGSGAPTVACRVDATGVAASAQIGRACSDHTHWRVRASKIARLTADAVGAKVAAPPPWPVGLTRRASRPRLRSDEHAPIIHIGEFEQARSRD